MNLKPLAAGLLLLSLASCEDKLLNITSQTNLTTATYFQTQADFQAAVTATYEPLRGLYNQAYVMGEMHSDNARYQFNPADRGQQDAENVADFIAQPSNGFVYNKYVTNYRIISRANQVLAQIDAATFDQTARNTIKGEALFLRALAYAELAQYYGQVPLHLVPVTDRSQTALPLSPTDSVYARVIRDARQAAALLPGKRTQVAGRATSGAANTLLGNIYLVRRQYVAAETALRLVVSSGDYSLLPSYAAAFDPANKNSSESVFEVQYQVGSDGYASNFIYGMLPRPLAAATVATLTGVTNPQAILQYEAFDVPTPDLIAAYETGDARQAATIAYTTTTTGVQYPYVRKYLHPHSQFNLTNDNWPVYRYSEVLLLLAEALNEQGRSTDAAPFLNQVRTRAGLAATTQTGQTNLRTAIANERRVELAFENKRWLDLVRTGQAVSTITAYGTRVKANPQAYYFPAGAGPVPSAFTNVSLTFPLPAAEAQLSPYF
jgi:hypothetical protein